MGQESTPVDPTNAVEASMRACNDAETAVEQLDDASDEVLLRHIATSRDGDVSDTADLSLYSTSVFLLQDRGYETDMQDGDLVVFDPSGNAIDLASIDTDL